MHLQATRLTVWETIYTIVLSGGIRSDCVLQGYQPQSSMKVKCTLRRTCFIYNCTFALTLRYSLHYTLKKSKSDDSAMLCMDDEVWSEVGIMQCSIIMPNNNCCPLLKLRPKLVFNQRNYLVWPDKSKWIKRELMKLHFITAISYFPFRWF